MPILSAYINTETGMPVDQPKEEDVYKLEAH